MTGIRADFLVGLKAASYPISPPPEANYGVEAREFNSPPLKIGSSIFPRGILHPSSLSPSDSAGKKSARGYLLCKRSAALHFVRKGSLWQRLDSSAQNNVLLPFQIESQLRKRVHQELEILVGSRSDDDPVFSDLTEDMYEQSQERGYLDISMFRARPAALLVYSSPSIGKVESRTDQPVFSRILPYRMSPVKAAYTNLATHRVPMYGLSVLFSIPPPRIAALASKMCASAQLDEQGHGDTEREARRTRSGSPRHRKVVGPPQDYSELAITHPKIYEREVSESNGMLNRCQDCIAALLSSKRTTTSDASTLQMHLCSIPMDRKELLPLLVALWRCRMWSGEGWSGDGMGVQEATGRKQICT
ncbi:MAG: hypothetical protein CYPHOPRED_000803 [Cyphobasidiales sp. Tagirdzhanova-0007]|nr:MAG: hypothetical protein CYPHOPRED_000803 [Cyphobasidiales sp. Tagirdzhanova-0007]